MVKFIPQLDDIRVDLGMSTPKLRSVIINLVELIPRLDEVHITLGDVVIRLARLIPN